jgi:hypothetical protein
MAHKTKHKPAARDRKNQRFVTQHGGMTKTDWARTKRGLSPIAQE